MTHADATSGSGVAILFEAKDGFPEQGDNMQRRLYEVADEFTYTSNTFDRLCRELPPKDSGALPYWDIDCDSYRWRPWPYFGPYSSTVSAADARLVDPGSNRWHSPSRNLFGQTIQKLVLRMPENTFPLRRQTRWDGIKTSVIWLRRPRDGR